MSVSSYLQGRDAFKQSGDSSLSESFNRLLAMTFLFLRNGSPSYMDMGLIVWLALAFHSFANGLAQELDLPFSLAKSLSSLLTSSEACFTIRKEVEKVFQNSRAVRLSPSIPPGSLRPANYASVDLLFPSRPLLNYRKPNPVELYLGIGRRLLNR